MISLMASLNSRDMSINSRLCCARALLNQALAQMEINVTMLMEKVRSDNRKSLFFSFIFN